MRVILGVMQAVGFTSRSSAVTCNFNCRSKLNLFKRQRFIQYVLLKKTEHNSSSVVTGTQYL